MDTADVLIKLRDSLATDPELIGWCVSNLGKTPTIQIDFEDIERLEADLFPVVCIVGIEEDGNIFERKRSFKVAMLAGAMGEYATKDTHSVETSNGNVTVTTRTYEGRLEAEALRCQAIKSIYRNKFGNVAITTEMLTHTFHPRVYSPFSVTIEAIL